MFAPTYKYADDIVQRVRLVSGTSSVNKQLHVENITPLHFILNGNHRSALKEKAVEHLLDLGADPMIKNRKDQTPLSLAKKDEVFMKSETFWRMKTGS